MSESKSSFNIDEMQTELLARGGVETICQFYGIDHGELLRRVSEIRTACFLQCGKENETGIRAISFDTDKPRWHCYEYGCGKGGNLVSLCGYARFGTELMNPVRGSQFKAIRDDVRAMLGEKALGQKQTSQPQSKPLKAADEQRSNIPLKDSPIEAARALVNLDEQCLIVPDERMSRHAAAYLRVRPYLTAEACRKWRTGFLPQDAKTLLRGNFIYPIISESGDILTWFGRDPQFETKRKKWISRNGPSNAEPSKHRFVKGFRKGLELFGQHRLLETEVRRRLVDFGVLPVVEGPNDVIALGELGIPAVAVCGNAITSDQTKRLSKHVKTLKISIGLMFDNDCEGDTGARQSLQLLAEHVPVRLLWSRTMFDGKYRDRQPESISASDWHEITEQLA